MIQLVLFLRANFNTIIAISILDKRRVELFLHIHLESQAIRSSFIHLRIDRLSKYRLVAELVRLLIHAVIIVCIVLPVLIILEVVYADKLVYSR